jgi:hypothetical protein
MPIPETNSAEAFERYAGGKCLRVGLVPAWKDIQASIGCGKPACDSLANL